MTVKEYCHRAISECLIWQADFVVRHTDTFIRMYAPKSTHNFLQRNKAGAEMFLQFADFYQNLEGTPAWLRAVKAHIRLTRVK